MVEIITIKELHSGDPVTSIEPIDIGGEYIKTITSNIIADNTIDSDAARAILNHRKCNDIISYIRDASEDIAKTISKSLELGLCINIDRVNLYNKYNIILSYIDSDISLR